MRQCCVCQSELTDWETGLCCSCKADEEMDGMRTLFHESELHEYAMRVGRPCECRYCTSESAE